MAIKKSAKALISSVLDYECPWFSVYKERVRYPNGHEGEYYVLKRPLGFVTIIAIDANKDFLILRQWRPTIKRWIYEIPMGGVTKGETPLKAAKRELLEETGYKAKSWKKIGEFWLAPGHSTEKGFVFLATDLVMITGKAEENPKEIIEVNAVSPKELEKMISEEKLVDNPSLSSLLIYKYQ